MRFFKLIKLTKPAQKNESTKIPKSIGKPKGSSIFIAKAPMIAARKALIAVCKNKKIKNTCFLKLVMVEIQTEMKYGSIRPMKSGNGKYIKMKKKVKGKEEDKTYTYKGRRELVNKLVIRDGIPVVYKYNTKILSV